MALPSVPEQSTLSLNAVPTISQRNANTPVALTSAGNTQSTMVNPTMVQAQSGLDALTGAGLGGLIGLMLDRNSKPSGTVSSTGLFKPTTSGTGSTGTGGTGGTGTGGTGSTPAPTGTSNQSDTVLGGMTGNNTSITTGFLQDSSGNLYKDLGNGQAQLMYEAIGNTNYIYQGPQMTTSSGQNIYPGAVIDQQGYQIAPNFNWYVNQSSNTTVPTGDLNNTDWTSTWDNYTGNTYPSYLDSGTPIDTSNTDYWTYIDTNIGPSWKEGGLATPMYASGGKVKGYADGNLVTSTSAPTSFTDQVVANQVANPSTTSTSTTNTTGGTGSPLSSITDLLTQHTGISGAVIGALLGQLLGGKSTGTINTGVDMSKVAGIQPRTTNFGIGPAQFATYQQYGTPTVQTPAYNNLYSNLGVSSYNPSTNPLLARRVATAKSPFYTFGKPADPAQYLAIGGQPSSGLSRSENPNIPYLDGGSNANVPVPQVHGRKDYRAGSYVEGAGDGQSDDIPAMLADGEYVIDAETVSQLGNGSNKAGAKVLDKFRENIRSHKRNTPLNKIPPKAKSPLAYLKGAK